ncbi:50S ribosomal protein L18 [Patescibacteria group bacterium]|nr:50S ribosomal protein L18 [Patescibacteria group bacterium]
MKTKIKREKKVRRHKRVRAKIWGTATRPRFCVFRSQKHIYVQLIDDEKGHILVATSDLELKKQKTKIKKATASPSPSRQEGSPKAKEIKKPLTRKVGIAFEVGKLIAKKAFKKKIKKVVFDRGGYKYHGRTKAVAEGAREGGLKF